MDAPVATVLEIQRMSTEDGPGIRTTVFFKGCTLACAWCHNPESISRRPQVVWHDWKCIGCRTCEGVCPEEAISFDADGMTWDRHRCTACGTCTQSCPTTARERVGQEWRLDDLVREVAKDRAYFETSGGGVTASGGEPAVQAPFVEAFLARCRELGLHTALDTCGMSGTKGLIRLVEHADLVLFDLKVMDPAQHARFTGHSNAKVLANVAAVRDCIRANGHPAEMWIRTPLIPGATATDENIRDIGAFIAVNLREVVTRWELCAFNNLCADKYRRLGMPWHFADAELLSREDQLHFEAVARRSGVDPDRVLVTGPTRLEQRGAAS
ncbi:MAG: glycyl-radical enzyme activating protein [Deltaproteobacteria bacterium]|nr:glycyl-radical enzyme activating protein [Deltaproteobacteria bacterium]